MIKMIKMNFTKRKSGTSKIMSVYWFAILVIVAGTIVYMVLIFYGSPYDVREIEANILINKVADCLSENGKLNTQINQDNFLEKCNLNFDTPDQEGQYYLEVEFRNFNDDALLDFVIIEGNVNLKDNPNMGSIFKSEKSFYVLKDENEELIVKILAVISKTKENVG